MPCRAAEIRNSDKNIRSRAIIRGDGLNLNLDISLVAFRPHRQGFQISQTARWWAELGIVSTGCDGIASGIIPALCELGERDLHSAKVTFWSGEVGFETTSKELATTRLVISKGDPVSR